MTSQSESPAPALSVPMPVSASGSGTSPSASSRRQSQSDEASDSGAASGKVYALLIAIDKYDSPGNNLHGCVRDSKEVERYLRDNEGTGDGKLVLRCLRSPLGSQDATAAEHPLPTRANIIAGFTEFLTQAGPDDSVFVHYSGHGFQARRPKELWHLDPEEDSEHLGETLVCKDSFTYVDDKLVGLLFDLEMRWMIARIAARDPHIVIMTDCCNSSGNTRDFDADVGIRSARSPEGDQEQNIADFVFYQQDDDARRQIEKDSTQYTVPQGRHVSLAACHNYQLAKEAIVRPHGKVGLFTFYALQVLRATRGRISYRDLVKLVRPKINARVAQQAPQYFSPHADDVDQIFLRGGGGGGGGAGGQETFTVRPGADARTGTLDAGSLHGIRPVADGKTQLLLFPPGVNIKDASARDGLTATVRSVAANESQVELEHDASFAADAEYYRAIVTATPVGATRVGIVAELDGEPVSADADDELVRGVELLESAVAANPFVELAGDSDNRDFTLFVYRYQGEYRYRIAEQDKIAAMIEPRAGFNDENARQLVSDLAHMARWWQTLHLSNDFAGVIRPDALSLIAIDGDGNEITDHDGQIVLHVSDDEQSAPTLKFKVKLNDKDHVPLYCALVHLSSDFAIDTNLLPPDTHLGRVSYSEGRSQIEREALEAYAGAHIRIDGKTDPLGLYLKFRLPPGKDVDFDHYKLIASTTQFDPMSLQLSALGRASKTRGAVPARARSQLEALMQTVATRATSGWAIDDDAAASVPDWWTTTITVKVMRRPASGPA